jgi:putative DNA primase/helicase
VKVPPEIMQRLRDGDDYDLENGALGASGGSESEYSESEDAAHFRPWRSRSFLTAADIIGKNARNVLEGDVLEFNEMLQRHELGGRALRDSDIARIQKRIEERFTGGLDKNKNEIGLQLSEADIRRAVFMVAEDHAYHPVRNYLRDLRWDGVKRIDSFAAKALGLVDELPRVLWRRWFLSAAARPLKPGCKVDTVLVLEGAQGLGKSTVFRELAGPEWFVDTAIDITSKDALQIIHQGWIVEWAELESLRRASAASAFKSFVTSPVDTYRPPHARLPIQVPRTCVIVGTTNERQFLTDDTGNRRFWPVEINRRVDIEWVRANRAQLWAEAVVAVDGAERWWLDEREEELLEDAHDEHHSSDSWTDAVLAWVANPIPLEPGKIERLAPPLDDFTTADVLQFAIGKPRGQWTTPDTKRVAAILRAAGWELATNKPKGRSRPWVRRSR